DDIVPIYREFKGWMCDTTKMRTYEELPVEFKEYIKFIEEETGVPVQIISLGPDREETIMR
ncbi:MAG: adenylosuccinate synthetase, partial [Rikenellaceae bacterium]|nr:adenylosuccinate synthetase [Rikenellaceae bacterium]